MASRLTCCSDRWKGRDGCAAVSSRTDFCRTARPCRTRCSLGPQPRRSGTGYSGLPGDGRLRLGHGSGMRGRGPIMGSQGGGHFMQRHMFYMRGGLPPAYAVLSNPLTATSSILSGGADLYAANCASCYGSNGYGDGDAGQSLVPPPANIAATARMPMMADSFLYWSIAEGGEPFGTAMPAVRDSLTPDEIRAIVTYLRAGLPTGRQVR